MANYDIFDEQYYLSQYPGLKTAIDRGIIKSGKDHFERFGQTAGLTKVSRYFDESNYLAKYPQIAALIRTPANPNLPFASGLDHFIQYGYEQGRTEVSPEYDEAFYLANNRDLLPFIQNGSFKNGYQHFIKFGSKESRFGTSFFEPTYLFNNPDLSQAISSGILKTGREHYFKYGQFETGRKATFVGTSGNDILTSFGVGNVELIGVEVGLASTNSSLRGQIYESDGSQEFDTLIGGSGRDKFVLADVLLNSRAFVVGTANLYIGEGFATIRNFTKGQDSIQLPGNSFDQFLVFPINNNRDLAIQTNGLPVPTNIGFGVEISSFDTIAIIEGGGNLSLNVLSQSPSLGTLLVG
ncbi:calcium-binding protein [Oscillatoriales cyanobacterium USR001]|nr:calcium-binding protein [Oscillatoriales cyanobacterium USR001]